MQNTEAPGLLLLPEMQQQPVLVFYINRAGRNLSKGRRDVLERAKDELRRLYGRPTRAKGGR